MQLRSALHFLLRHLFRKGEKHKKGEIAWEKIFRDLDIMKNKMVLEITELRKIYQIHNKYMDIYLYVSSYLDSRCLLCVYVCDRERGRDREKQTIWEEEDQLERMGDEVMKRCIWTGYTDTHIKKAISLCAN